MRTIQKVAKGLAALLLTAGICLYPNAAQAERGINLKPLLGHGLKLPKAPSGRIRAINLGDRNHGYRAPNLRPLQEIGKRLGATDSHRRHGGGYGGGNYGGLHPLNGQDIQDAINFLDRNYGDRRYEHDRYYHDSDKAYADAYRDVGIANAVANVVGTIVTSQPGVAYQNGGRYERQKVVIKPGYYEDVRVWVPDMTDSRTGERIMGHYETHQRWVPEVYGYQDVWVP